MQQTSIQFILGKLQKLLADPRILHMVGQPKTTVNFAELLDTGSILLVKVSPEQWQLACVVCSGILGQFVNAAYARRNAQEQEEPERFRFYADGYTWQHIMQRQQ